MQVSTPGVDEAHHYMLQQARQLVAQAKKRGGLIAEVSCLYQSQHSYGTKAHVSF